ncbi:MAG: porin, partial [Planctomycetota bacterium]
FDSRSGLALARWQWNPAGEVLPFSQSDLVRRPSPVSSIALATVFGRTPFTRFSGSGGGDLPGFDRGDYDLRQFLIETAWHYRGIAWQQELHWKDFEDRATGETTRLIGGYAQVGSFLNEWRPAIPPQLELVARGSLVDPDRSLNDNSQSEWTLGANWFINGHRNKLTADVSWLDVDSPAGDASQTRFRLQWELSI